MLKQQSNRQQPRTAVATLTPTEMGALNGVVAKLPMGALVVDVGLVTAQEFNSATTATGTIGDGTTSFVAGQDVKVAGTADAAVRSKYYPSGGEITFSLAQTGAAATAGRAIGYVTYLVVGAGDEIYG